MSESSLLFGNTLLALFVGKLLGVSVLTEESSVVNIVLLSRRRISTDGLVSVGVDFFQHITGDTVLDVARELLLVEFVVFFLERVHVFSNGLTEDLVTVSFSIVGLFFAVVTVETSVLVGNINTAIVAALEDSEDTSTSGGSAETDIEVAAERTLFAEFSDVVSLLVTFAGLDFTVDSFVTLVHFSHTELGQETSGTEETSAVSSSVIGKTELDTVARKFSRGGLADDAVTNDFSRDDLSNHLVVGNTGNKSVLGGVVLVLGLDDESLTSIVISLTFYAIRKEMEEESVCDRDEMRIR